jgi:heparan-sulfate lyase
LEPERLFSLLNLDTPGMEKVKAAAEAEEFNRAEEELLNYMRHRENVRTVVSWRTVIPWRNRVLPWKNRFEYKGKYASKEDMAIADDALKHIFGGHPGDWKMLFPAQQFGKDIDWKSKAVKDKEWIWHFNMMPFWKPLSKAYWHTADEKYAQEFFRQIDDWIAKNPPDGNNTTWRRLDAGVRAGWFWPVAYFHCLTSPSLTPRTHSRILLGFHEHAVFLNSSNFNRGNWGIYEARGAFFVSVLFPEFSQARAWRENALGHLTRQILKEVGPDGGYIEKCPHYHIDCIHIFQSALDLARLNDIKVPESYIKSVEKMYAFLMFTSLPDGTAPRIGDSWLEPVREILADGAKRFNRKDMEFVATEGARGTAPKQTSLCLKSSGFSVMRDGWDEKSQYLLMKWKYGGWHSHCDELSIILAAGGRILLDDSSTIDYKGGGKPKSNATCSHSTIAIAGKNRPSRLKQTRLNQWLHGTDIDYVDASGPATQDGHTHRRRIAYVRGKYWVMIDDIRGEKKGTDQVDMYFQFAPSEVRVDGLIARTDFKEGANLMVKIMEIPGLTAQQEEGWIAVEYNVVKPRPRVRFSVNRLPVKLTSLLYPYEGEAPSIAMEKMALPENVQDKGVFGLRIRINGKEDLIFFAPTQCEFSYQGAGFSGPVAYIQH